MSAISVSAYLDLINDNLRSLPSTQLVVEGEVSDFRIAQGKWVSFDLKDEKEQAVLKCFMTVWQLKAEVESGMRVQVVGYPKVYERFGTFKMNVQHVQPVGEGALARAYQMLKKQLEQEGLFDPARKRAFPRFVQRIGLVTSRDAAAYGDFLQILNNRWGGVQVLHAHVHVQGQHATQEITDAFARFNALAEADRPDVIVLTRGGGGLEDLHAFNDEQVVRAVYGSKIPVVVAVGHERDESLADFVADVRASTPSNAAERVVPSRSDVLYEIEMMQQHIERQIDEQVRGYQHSIEQAASMMSGVLDRHKQRLEGMVQLLHSFDPRRVLARGYSLVRLGGEIVKDGSTLEPGAQIDVQFASGSAQADVTHVSP